MKHLVLTLVVLASIVTPNDPMYAACKVKKVCGRLIALAGSGETKLGKIDKLQSRVEELPSLGESKRGRRAKKYAKKARKIRRKLDKILGSNCGQQILPPALRPLTADDALATAQSGLESIARDPGATPAEVFSSIESALRFADEDISSTVDAICEVPLGTTSEFPITNQRTATISVGSDVFMTALRLRIRGAKKIRIDSIVVEGFQMDGDPDVERREDNFTVRRGKPKDFTFRQPIRIVKIEIRGRTIEPDDDFDIDGGRLNVAGIPMPQS